MLHAFLTSEDPMEELTRFMVLCFSDLKKYKFVHWFAFPSLVARPNWQFVAEQGGQEQQSGCRPALDVLGADQVGFESMKFPDRGLTSYYHLAARFNFTKSPRKKSDAWRDPQCRLLPCEDFEGPSVAG